MNRLRMLEQQLEQRGRATGRTSLTRGRSPTAPPRPAPRRAVSLGAVDATVPGIVDPLAQQSSMVCWATVTAILMGWRDRMSYDVAGAMDQVGTEWGDMVRANRGLLGRDKARFLAAAGLVAEPPMSYTIDAWAQMLRRFGPLWVTTDEDPTAGFSIHARVLTAIRGDGTPDGTMMTFADPNGGKVVTETVTQCLVKYESEAATPGRALRIQVVHWPEPVAQSARHSHSQSFGRYVAASQRQPRAQGGPAAVGVAIAGVGWSILSAGLQNDGDIHWRVQRMEGAKHPWDQIERYDRPPWASSTFEVRAARVWPAIFGPLSATFEVRFRHNGHSVGFVDIQNTGTSDVALWGIDIESTIMPDPDAYTIGSASPLAKVDLVFNYHFTRVAGDDKIWVGRYSLYGNGQVATSTRWTQ